MATLTSLNKGPLLISVEVLPLMKTAGWSKIMDIYIFYWIKVFLKLPFAVSFSDLIFIFIYIYIYMYFYICPQLIQFLYVNFILIYVFLKSTLFNYANPCGSPDNALNMYTCVLFSINEKYATVSIILREVYSSTCWHSVLNYI